MLLFVFYFTYILPQKEKLNKITSENKVLNEQVEILYNTMEDIDEKEREQTESKLKPITISTFRVTAYSYGTKTSTGVKPQEGITCAVDPDIIPYGSLLYIESVDDPNINYVLRAQDTLAFWYKQKYKGKVIDIYMNSKSECKVFGVKQMKVWIIED